ncbi:hypothetical protein BWR59_12515 [Pseudomonas sp. Bc-h]|uniref:hypothetical protein n=1 Tax=Pseudomonas sp. Bc-h TaxID=1943632 RepID=UPI0009DA9448|nr:hypothetical protein [Pseudomonas sp. Bc-h]OQR32772.1 hypothetical protein BWR59_12515 [Pseudomonas sp. Bc-h]
MTITIKGAPRKFDQSQLKQRQAGYHHMYRNTAQCCTPVHDEIAFGFLTKVIELNNAGYTLSSKYPISTSPMSYHAHMVKPDSVQVVELEAIDERVKQEYIDELQSELTEYRELLRLQLLEKAELAEQKKIADKKAKLNAEVQKEIDDAFGIQVVVPE